MFSKYACIVPVFECIRKVREDQNDLDLDLDHDHDLDLDLDTR